MKLLTKELRKKFPPLYSQEKKKPNEVPIIAKFFDPTGSWAWYATEGGEEDGNYIFFGYVRGFENELGYFSLTELERVESHFGLGIERDLHFGEHTLKEVMEKRL